LDYPSTAIFGIIQLSISISPGRRTLTMKGYAILLAATLPWLLLPCGCSEEPTMGIPRPIPIDQGITGLVQFWEGNFMPPSSQGQILPVRREIRVHEPTNLSQVEILGGGFYEEVDTPLVGVVWSDENGHFEIPLEPGTYSLFVIENGLYYANGNDGPGFIWPVEVRPDVVSNVVFKIDYKAYY
jgi:hypothetical protein